MLIRDLQRLCCPQCHQSLSWRGATRGAPPRTIGGGPLVCAGCAASWPARDGMPALYREEEVRGNDRLMRLFYDWIPQFHDPAVRYLLPIWQLEGTEAQMRAGYVRRMELGGLQAPVDGGPVRILDVSIGTGVSVALIHAALPPGLPVEYWGLDLATGMLRICKRRLHRQGFAAVRLVQGDAHALPFGDASFDRVFHVGGIGGFNEPGRAMAEMARVARPGTPIVVVDEQLDPNRSHGWWPRIWFDLVTFYDKNPHAPREFVPADALEVVEEQVGRFYYCLTFRTPVAG